jgi:ribose transport system permease protein
VTDSPTTLGPSGPTETRGAASPDAPPASAQAGREASPPPHRARQGIVERVRTDSRIWLVAVLVVVIVVFSLKSSAFLSQANWLDTTSTATEVLLLALGQTFVIITGGIDLSDGAVLGLAGMVGAWVMTEIGGPLTGGHADLVVVAGFAAALATGVFVGLVNGTLIARYRIPAFVVTLGALGICTGISDLVYNGQEITTIPTVVGTIGSTDIGGWIPIPVLVAAVVSVGAAVALGKTRFGEHTYAIGDSRESAVRAGIRDGRHLVKIYVLSSSLAALSGILVMTRLAVASPTSGSNDELNAIAAVVIGGASLFGGKGTILGSVLGTALIAVLLTGLIIINVPPFWQLIAVGAVLIAAVYVDQVKERGASA